MTQPPGYPPPPPPPPSGWVIPPPPGPPAAYGAAPGYTPPAGYRAQVAGGGPGRGKVSPNRLILTFVVVLAIGLALGAAVVLALQPGAKKPVCPDPTVACGQPPVAPTLPPIANASPAPAITPAPTIVRPSGTLVISSSAPTARPSAAPTLAQSPAPSASSAPSVAPTLAPTPEPSVAPSPTPVVANLPQPQPATNAEALHTGTVWTSSSIGFSLEYDAQLWDVQDEGANSLVLSAGKGAVIVAIEGFKASGSSTKSLVQQKINSLSDSVLGLTEESDASRQLPGIPVIGHVQGVGALLNGSLNTPQGPGGAVDVVVIAASKDQVSLRVTIVADDSLRDPAFSVSDTLLNSIIWPAAQ